MNLATKPPNRRDRAGGSVLIAPDQIPEHSRGPCVPESAVEPTRSREQHRDLAPLGLARTPPRRTRLRLGRLRRRAPRSPSTAAGDCPATRRAVRDRARVSSGRISRSISFASNSVGILFELVSAQPVAKIAHAVRIPRLRFKRSLWPRAKCVYRAMTSRLGHSRHFE